MSDHGDIPYFRTIPNPPISYCAVDYFGPMTVKGEVNKRYLQELCTIYR